MSRYENYSRVARHYDASRRAVGVEIIAGCLAQGAPLAEQHLLDAGCGTGNYAQALLAHVGRVSAVDLNARMLARARAKCGATGRIDFHQAAIDALPFADATFDGAMVNQVLHHLDLDAGAGYPAYRRVFAEFARVLKPGGALVINTCSRMQLRRGFWYYRLIPEAASAMRARHAPLKILRRLLDEAGLDWQSRIAPLDALMQGDAYFNPRGPLDESWRNGDSIWSTVSAPALAAACAQITALDRRNKLRAYMQKQDAPRRHIGQLSFLYTRRRPTIAT